MFTSLLMSALVLAFASNEVVAVINRHEGISLSEKSENAKIRKAKETIKYIQNNLKINDSVQMAAYDAAMKVVNESNLPKTLVIAANANDIAKGPLTAPFSRI